MNTNPISARKLIEAKADSLKPFPQVVLDIVTVLDDEEANANRLVDNLHRDVVLSGKVLGQANAATNRLPGQRTVTDVNSAVAMLGFSRIRTLVTTLAVRETFATSTPVKMAEKFWGHSVDVGTAAKVIAEHAGLKPDLAYVAGLMHDIGVFWVATHHPREYGQISTLLDAPEHHLIEMERQTLGTDHAEIGAALCEFWGLPAEIQQPVSGHHNPDGLPPDPYVMCVHLAEMACNALDLGKRPRNIVTHLSEKTLPLLGLEWQQMPDLLGEIEARARFMRVFSGIPAT
jgi:putative nucleotidyltransferase with HDIG domain